MGKFSSGTYRVIRPDQIAELPNPGFPNGPVECHRDEEDYYNFLLKCQAWFAGYPNSDKEKAWVDNADLSYVFEDVACAITVRTNADGQYVVSSNGRHRMFVARKYGLSLLVCIVNG